MKALTVVLVTLTIFSGVAFVGAKPAKTGDYYKANGKIESYVDVVASEIVNGNWWVTVDGDDVDFSYYYHELNIDESVENSPEGTVDHFKITLTDLYWYDIDYDTGELVVVGHLTWEKKWWNLDTGKPEWLKPFIFMDVRIMISHEGIEIDSWNDDSVNVVGSTLNVHYSPPGSGSNKKGVVYRANGMLEEYLPASAHAEVVKGYWNIEVKGAGGGYDVNFKAHYFEENLGGEGAHVYDQAVGKIDHFPIEVTEANVVVLEDDVCVVDVHFWINHVKHWDPETMKPWFDPPGLWDWGYATISIDSSGIIIVRSGLGFTGTTTSIHH
jgi:hypothetical protein